MAIGMARASEPRGQKGQKARRARRAALALGGAMTVAAAPVVWFAAASPSDASSAATTSTTSTTSTATASHAAATAVSGDSPAGFWYGTDSSYMPIPGPAPYKEPVIGGNYGGYVGMIGNWAGWKHCGGKVVWSKTDSHDAHVNFARHSSGIGVAGYWFMAGPGVDPHYNATTREARAWGAAQAARVLQDLPTLSTKLDYPVIFMDVEIPGNAPTYTPAPDNGWNTVYTSACSGRVRSHHIPAQVDRAEFNGFANYLTNHSAYKAGVYSAPGIWRSIFGTGSAASIPNTYEWTYTANSRSLSHHPSGWCLSGTTTCAHFFGGQTSRSKYALMWQWSGGGGSYNGHGDFDQIDANRTP